MLPTIIHELLINCELKVDDLNAIAISEGPGSYTGLRIGTATAKGLAYSLDLPLIAVNSLDSMIEQVKLLSGARSLLCPMIDARRMEVFCKMARNTGEEVWDTRPLIVEEDSFADFKDDQIILFGNGADKLRDILRDGQFLFIKDIHPQASAMGELAFTKFQNQIFADLAYLEPEYLKEYRTNTPSQKFKV